MWPFKKKAVKPVAKVVSKVDTEDEDALDDMAESIEDLKETLADLKDLVGDVLKATKVMSERMSDLEAKNQSAIRNGDELADMKEQLKDNTAFLQQVVIGMFAKKDEDKPSALKAYQERKNGSFAGAGGKLPLPG